MLCVDSPAISVKVWKGVPSGPTECLRKSLVPGLNRLWRWENLLSKPPVAELIRRNKISEFQLEIDFRRQPGFPRGRYMSDTALSAGLRAVDIPAFVAESLSASNIIAVNRSWPPHEPRIGGAVGGAWGPIISDQPTGQGLVITCCGDRDSIWKHLIKSALRKSGWKVSTRQGGVLVAPNGHLKSYPVIKSLHYWITLNFGDSLLQGWDLDDRLLPPGDFESRAQLVKKANPSGKVFQIEVVDLLRIEPP